MACQWARKRELILFSDCLDCLPERAFRAYFATRDCSALVHSKILCFGHIMTRFVQSRRLKIWDPSSSTTFFCAVLGKLVFVFANIKRKKPTWPISAILTLRFVNKLNAYIVRAVFNPLSTNAPSYFWKDLWDCHWGQEKNVVQLLSSAVTIPQKIPGHISVPVTFSFPSVKYKMNCQN